MLVASDASGAQLVCEVEIGVVVAAPRERVFAAWTRPEDLARWWGPRDFTVPFCGMDVRPHGSFRICIRSPEGRDHWMRGVFHEIHEPERIVFSHAWEDDGRETLACVSFALDGRGTRLAVRHEGLGSHAERASYEVGWREALARLASYVTASMGPG
ncbi:MAG: SRPBCC domain-containing protein [Thermodesulfobacteriota bacterium]